MRFTLYAIRVVVFLRRENFHSEIRCFLYILFFSVCSKFWWFFNIIYYIQKSIILQRSDEFMIPQISFCFKFYLNQGMVRYRHDLNFLSVSCDVGPFESLIFEFSPILRTFLLIKPKVVSLVVLQGEKPSRKGQVKFRVSFFELAISEIRNVRSVIAFI